MSFLTEGQQARHLASTIYRMSRDLCKGNEKKFAEMVKKYFIHYGLKIPKWIAEILNKV